MKCILCESNVGDFEVIHNTVRGDTLNHTNVVKCKQCGHIQLSHIFDNLINHYENDNQHKEIKKTFNKTDEQIKMGYFNLAKGVISRLSDYGIEIKTNTKVMDFGSGTQILPLLMNTEFNCFVDSVEISETIVASGLEYFEDIYKKCNDKLRIIVDDINFKQCKNKYNVITMIHVLEHLDNFNIITDLYNMLENDGKLVIEVPNQNDIMLRISEKYKNIAYQMHHISYFNEETFKILLDKLDIKNYKIHYYHRYDNIKNFLGFVLDTPLTNSCLGDQSTTDSELHNFWINGMVKSKCTDCMTIVISKK